MGFPGKTKRLLIAELERLNHELTLKQIDSKSRTVRRKQDNRIHQYREILAISKCNREILKSKSEEELLSRVCKVIITSAGYKLAWIGYCEYNDVKTLRPVAWAGKGSEQIAEIQRSWSEESIDGQMPAAIAIRSGKTSVIQDIAELAGSDFFLGNKNYGRFRSGISIPLKDENKRVFGTLQVYSKEPGYFTPLEIELLENLASDLAFSINTQRIKQSRDLAEAKLRKSEEELNEAQKIAGLGSWVCDYKTLEFQMSDNMCRLMGVDPDPNRMTIKSFMNRIPPENLPLYEEFEKRIYDGNNEKTWDFRYVKPNGEKLWFRTKINYITENGSVTKVVGTNIDITSEKKKEQELLNKTNRLTAIIHAIPDLVFIFDAEGKCREFNPGKGKMLMVNKNQIIGEDIDLVFGKASGEHLPNIRKAIDTGDLITYEFSTVIHGMKTFFEARLTPLNTDTVLFLARDVTVSKMVNEEVEKLSKAVEQSPVSVVVTNTEGTIEYVNPWFTKITGYEFAEAIGKNPRILKSDFHDRDFYTEMWSKLLSGEEWRGNIRNKKKNGELYWEAVLISPLKNEYGEVTNYIGIKEDITDKVSALLALQDSEQRLQAIVDTSLTGISIIDEDGIIHYCNPASEKIHGYSSQEMKGTHIGVISHPDDLEDEIRQLKEIISGEKQFVFTELRLIHKITRKVVWINVNVSRYPKMAKEDKNSILIVFQDITGKKEMEQQLKNMIYTRDKLFSIIAHDLRGPIGNLIPILDILAGESELDEDFRNELFEGMRKATLNTFDLLENLLSWAKYQSNSIKLKPVLFDIHETIQEITDLYSTYAIMKSIRIVTEAKERMSVFADKDSVKLVIRNLLSNAIKFTPRNGIISVKACKNGDGVTVEVRDNGTGMTKEMKEKLFVADSFVSAYGTENEKGSGLGLILCKEFIEKNGGRLSVESAPGEGSRFSFNLPGKEHTGTEKPDRHTINNQTAELFPGKHFLLVEDDSFNQYYAKKMIANWQASVELASNGKEALERLRIKTFDLILMDIEMPDLDGLSTIKLIRNELHLETPAIAISANTMDEQRNEALLSGFNDYVVKPASPNELNAKIEKLLAGKKITRNEKPVIISPAPGGTRKFSNTDKLKRAMGDDPVLTRDMISKFIEVTPPYFHEMLAAYDQGNLNSVRQLSHKLKSSISLLSEEEISQNIILINEYAGKPDEKEKLESLMHSFREWFPVLCEELQKELEK